MSRILQSSATQPQTTVTDPEGIEALNEIDKFEDRCLKKPNRYPKASLDTENKLDTTMKTKIQLRAQIT